jgi:hypothetical protein
MMRVRYREWLSRVQRSCHTIGAIKSNNNNQQQQ